MTDPQNHTVPEMSSGDESTETKAKTYQVPLEVYEKLERATPEEKADIVLWLIKEHPEGRLELPVRDGKRANLSGVRLDPSIISLKIAQLGLSYPDAWLSDDSRRVNLWKADLRGAILDNANLQEALLIGANLQGALLRDTELQGANLQDAHLEKAAMMGAKLQNALLIGADLQEANLMDADLQGAILWHANLQGACLRNANLQRATLQGAYLQRADLWKATLAHTYINGAWLDRTKLRWEQLDKGIGEESDSDYGAAKQAYMILKQNFEDLGDYDAASRAYRRERRMEKREAHDKA